MKPEYIWQSVFDPAIPLCARRWESGLECHARATRRVQNVGTGELSEERYCDWHADIEARSRARLPSE